MTNPITVNSTKTVTSIIRNGTAIEKMMLAWEWQPQGLFLGDVQAAWYDPIDTGNEDWRRNLLTWSEDFSNAVWLISNATKTSSTKITATNVNQIHAISNPFNHVSGQTYTYQQVLTYENTRYVSLRIFAGVFPHVCFDLTGDGAIAASDTGAVGTITKLSSGSFLCTITVTATSTGVGNASIFLQTGTTNLGATWLAIGTEAVSATAAQLELGSTATAYQRITDVDTEVRALFPNNTMFQDHIGVAPNAAASSNQVVGEWLDKSKLLALGPELVTNGTFVADSDWNKLNGATISGGVATLFNATTNAAITQTRNFTIGRTYRVSITWTGTISAGLGNYGSGDVRFITSGTVGSFTGYVTISAGTGATIWVQALVNSMATVDNISVKEVPGNHALQTSTSLRPLFGRAPVSRRNLLIRTEEFENNAWAKTNSTIASNVAVAPDGSTTADKLVGVAANTYTRARQSFTFTSGTIYNFSVYAKAAELPYLYMVIPSTLFPTNQTAFFDLLSGEKGTVTGGTASIISVGNGWYRCSITTQACTTTGSSTAEVLTTSNASNNIYTNNGTSGIFIWGAQLEIGSVATPYQKVVSALDITEAGKPSYAFMRPDLSDDKLTTNMASTKNLLQYTEEFSNAFWSKSSVTINENVTTAPDGTLSADGYDATAVSSGLTKASYVPAGTYTFSCYFKANTSSVVGLLITTSGNGTIGTFNLATETFTVVAQGTGGTTSNRSGALISVGGGWFRASITLTSSGINGIIIGGGGLITDDFYFWGAQLELGATATLYEYGGFKGDVVVAGKNGTAYETNVTSPTGVMDLGPLTYTGGTPGILRAVGDVVGYTMARKKFTDVEKAQLVRYYKKRGAKGLLVPSPELGSDVATNWVSVAGGSVVQNGEWIVVTSAGATGTGAALSIPTNINRFYQFSMDVELLTATIIDIQLSLTSTGGGDAFSPSSYYYTTSNRTIQYVGICTDATSPSFLTVSPRVTGLTCRIRNISIKELRPEEEW